MSATNVIERTLKKMEVRPSNDLPDKTYRAIEPSKGWDDQWGNWDDLGGDDPGWGDISD